MWLERELDMRCGDAEWDEFLSTEMMRFWDECGYLFFNGDDQGETTW